MINTYEDLIGQIESCLADTSVSTQSRTLIQLAEKQFDFLLNTLDQETRSEANTVGGERYLEIPPDFSGAKRITLLQNGLRIPLIFDSEIDKRYGAIPSGQPEVYSIEGTEIAFGPIPDGAYLLEILFIRDIRPLSDDNPTNFLLSVAPHLYLWDSLVLAEAWLHNDERIPVWKQFAQEALAGLLRWDRGNRYPSRIFTQHGYGTQRVRHG